LKNYIYWKCKVSK